MRPYPFRELQGGKTVTPGLLVAVLLVAILSLNCKKETPCENCNSSNVQPNRPPVAKAGPDQVITLPVNTVTLDATGSSDPDNNITGYAWTKISGPVLHTFSHSGLAQTQVTNLVQGEYLFELKVTDARGLTGWDTVMVTVNPAPGTSLADVYVAGTAASSINEAVYWKNGQAVYLGGGYGFSGTSIAVSGGRIAVAATLFESGVYAGSYWVGDTPHWLGINTIANDVAISGNDVYVAGSQLNPNGTSVAKYWKNGQEVLLSSVTSQSEANSIVVVGTDVYVAGKDGHVAKYWKNGQAISLSNGSAEAIATAIAVAGSDVYVAGCEAGRAKYWKNGQEVMLTDGTNSAYAADITVSGGDVYVAGWESTNGIFPGGFNVAKYWKNGQPVSLTGVNAIAYATSIAVHGTDIYVAGSEHNGTGNVAKYWKNGQSVPLTTGAGYDGAMGIVVVNR